MIPVDTGTVDHDDDIEMQHLLSEGVAANTSGRHKTDTRKADRQFLQRLDEHVNVKKVRMSRSSN